MDAQQYSPGHRLRKKRITAAWPAFLGKAAGWRGEGKIISLLWGTVTGGLLAAALWLAPYVWSYFNRPISHVRVIGDFRHLSHASVQKKVEPYVQGSYFSLDLVQLRALLLQEPWLHAADLTRIWPDTIEVRLWEQVPIARWGKSSLMSASQTLLPIDGENTSRLPELAGPKGREQEVMDQYLLFTAQLQRLKLQINSVHLSPAGSWKIRIGDTVIHLGESEVLLDRMQKFTHLYETHLRQQWKTVAHIDLRYRDGAAVAWKSARKTLSGKKTDTRRI